MQSRRTELREIPPASEWRGERASAKENSEEAGVLRETAGGRLFFDDNVIQSECLPVTECPLCARH